MNQSSKPLALLSITLFVILSVLFLQHTTINSHQEIEKLENLPSQVLQTKYILYWTTMFGNKEFNLGVGSEIFAGCSYNNCYATYNQHLLPIEKFDAILFHAVEYRKSLHGQPHKRNPNQIYIMSNQESPENTPSLSSFNNFYNWTMTYRLDSDIIRPYGYVEKKKTDYKMPSVKDIETRPKKIAWFVSNCDTTGERHKIYEMLKKFFPIDVYGLCGKLVCERERSNDCYKMLEKDYKFYLSFENSICDGYVTEKMYNILKRDIVPIVYSGADFRKTAPPKSVINVMNFDSIETLIKYIEYLDLHHEAYLRYFEWKKNYVINTSNNLTLCSLCRKLNEKIQPKVYEDISQWWFGFNLTKCIKNTFVKTFLS